MKAVIYARYSSGNQREESIEGQLRECYEYAKYNDIEIIDEYIDRAFSAKTDDRPDFQRLIADSNRKFFDAVLVWKLDRFARNRYDAAFYKHTLKKKNVRVLSVKENISDGPEGIILESMIEGMAEYYSANLSQNVKRGFKENALKLKWNGGNVPFGYKIVDGHYTINEDEEPMVLMIFNMCAEGKTIKHIFNYLKEKGIRRSNGKPIAYSSMRHMLTNRAYIGEFNHSGVFVEDGMPAIVSKDVFEKAQETIKKNSFTPAAKSEENAYLLTTKLFCGKCEALMTAYSGTSGTKKVYQYYACNRARKKACDKKKIGKEKIENFVIEKTMAFLNDDKIINYLAELLYNLQEEENVIIPKLEKQIAEKQKEIDNIIKAIQLGAVSESLMKKLNEIEFQKRLFEEELEKEKIKMPILTVKEFKMALLHFREIDVSTTNGKAKLIDTFINKIFVYDDRVKILYNIHGKEENITLEELESSNFEQHAQPKQKHQPYGWCFCFVLLSAEDEN